MFSVQKANNFIKDAVVNEKFYPEINLAAPVGWINDPNGVSVYKDEYHVFYQYYPYGCLHGPMHWGHAKTKDGVNWEHLPVALAPDEEYDKGGVFSGSAIEVNGNLALMYTGHLPSVPEEDSRQVQNIAVSKDGGVTFEKHQANPVIGEDMVPEGTSVIHFRDPNVFKKGDIYYAVVGSKSNDNVGQVLLYKSVNLLEWEFVNVILSDYDYLGDMAECPDLLLFEDKAVIIVSAMNYVEDGVFYPHKTMIVEGKMDWDTYTFIPEAKREMDYGFDYYAPQTAREEDGSYFNIAWHQVWNKTLVTSVLSHGWSGQMTIPQRIYCEEGVIYREIHPIVKEQAKLIESYDNSSIEDELELNGAQYIKLKVKKDNALKLRIDFKNEDEAVWLEFDFKNKTGSYSRKDTKYPIFNNDGTPYVEREFNFDLDADEYDIEIIKDTSSIQVYVNDYFSISNTFYSENKLDKINLICEGGTIEELSLYRLK